MGIRLLGPVELRTADGSPAEVAGAKRRAVLALLALDLGRSVPVERFFEMLWGDEPPAQAKAALQGHVAALRKVLDGTSFCLLTRSPGYLLTGDPDQVDLLHFEALTGRALAVADDAESAALLQEALNLWDGSALADLPDTDLCRALVERLDESRSQAVTAWAERQLRLGTGAAAIPALEQHVRADGLRERSVALLMRCLHQAGRLSDALTVYHHARTRLDDELGVTPGPALREALATVLADEPAPAQTVPQTHAPATPEPRPQAAGPARVEVGRSLPRQPLGFVGRTLESRWLDRECGADRLGSGLALVVGPAGAGKSSTVIRWAHAAGAGFPDGQLFVDLRGFDPDGPADPTEVLGQFLRMLGLSEAAIPEDHAARAALYREETQRRRLLVVLDNAGSARDVAALLPAGPDCSTVITSRNSLEDLVVTEGAAMLRLEALPAEDALGLLERLLTPGRVQAEPTAAKRLIALCDQLPLALRIAAARLASRPGWTLAHLVDELEDERTRLLALDTQGAVSVRTALSLTHRHLSPDAAQLLALLSAHPGVEVDAFSAAALLDTDLATARHALGSLAAYHLLAETTPGRYSRHDLIRLFGLELLAAQGPDAGPAAVVRLLDHYLEAARQAASRLQPGTDLFEYPGRRPRELPRIPDVRSALSWFRTEERTVRSLVAVAAVDGEHERAWRLAQISNVLYYGAGQLTDRLTCLRSGLKAARRSGSATAVALLETATAGALAWIRRAEEALPLVTDVVARTGPDDGNIHIYALVTLAQVTAVRGDLAEADRHSEAALELIRRTGLREHGAFTLSNAAALKGMSGDAETALHYARQARRLLADEPTATFQLSAMVNEAHALQTLQRFEAAELVWVRTLELCRTSGSMHLHAMTERQFAEFLMETGRPEDAAGHLESAVELYRQRGDLTLVDQLTEQLATVREFAG